VKSVTLFLLTTLLTACGDTEASAAVLQNVASACGLESAVVAETNSPTQSPLAIWFDSSETESLAKSRCISRKLADSGRKSALMLGSPGFTVSSDSGFFLIRVSDKCNLRREGLAKNGANEVTIYGTSDISASDLECARSMLKANGRFSKVILVEGPAPRIGLDFGASESK
jgi:hypothetical protein